ncbi:hypothetical protein C8A05DRAFT_33763 [Staphylotrichum tortipilum]|uniref:Subtelomeric hrmA-associated cluster protein AFUB-079030/YDR124W-like helical bundle domain-containing protein n=1 Tax=Staphylotrichum tortipilum TaxID=2831512 RepID=A0AAN6MLQ2_9PEZI|nr:hypothetical protein C8A05DRAFT_33763 [Staphylotrichum longicolle]
MVALNPNPFAYGRRWEEPRSGPDHVFPNANPIPLTEERTSPPLTVAKALQDHCNIPFQSFFLATHLGDGKFAYFSGPRVDSEADIHAMFRRDKFLQIMSRAAPRETALLSSDEEPDMTAVDPVHTHVGSNGRLAPESRRRKRTRGQGTTRRSKGIDPLPVIVHSKVSLRIGDAGAVQRFYESRLKAVQQTACKEIAKAFVKVIAPKKQARNPYTGGLDTAPDWWPEKCGVDGKEVRHIEPDHLHKPERIEVLKQILNLVINPEIQPPSMQRLEGLCVEKLETAAMESLSVFFQDPTKPRNARKRPILKELFRVARMEEKFRRDEIDASTLIIVTADDMVMTHCFDPSEEAEDDRVSTADLGLTTITTAAMPHALLPSLSPTVHSLTHQFQTSGFLQEMPVRPQPYGSPATLQSDLTADQYGYPTVSAPDHPMPDHAAADALQMHNMLVSPHHHHPGHPGHETSRRPSLFAPPTTTAAEFNAPYNTTAWSHSPPPPPPQASPATTAAATPESSPLFAFTPIQHHPPQPQHNILPPPTALLPMAHHHQQAAGAYAAAQAQYAHGPFDAMAHQQNQNTVFRGGSIQLTLQQHQGFGGFHGHHHSSPAPQGH